MKDDLARDELAQELATKVAEILGKYDTAIDVAAIKRDQAQNDPRNNEFMNANGL